MSHKQPAPHARSRPKHRRASQKSGLIANGKDVRQQAGPKAALDNRSHRTPEVELQASYHHCGEAATADRLSAATIR